MLEILIQTLFWLYLAADAAVLTMAAIPFLHMLQLESYQGRMYLKWLKKHKESMISYLFIAICGFLLRMAGQLLSPGIFGTIVWLGGDLIYTGLMLNLGLKARREQKNAKKPLKYTARVKRMLVPIYLISLLGPVLRLRMQVMYMLRVDLGLALPGNWLVSVILPELIRFLPGMLMAFVVLVAYLVMWPMEKSIQGWYMDDAKRILRKQKDLIRIGITGSYGKTSTKYALGTILAEKYNTLYTPGSFNTPMGVTRVIRENMKPEHQVFIAEMGARYVGDIEELCQLVSPEYGIITAVGKQHLETFGSFKNVKKTKGELLQGLSKDGVAFLNGDDPVCRELYTDCRLKEKYLFGTKDKDLYMKAENIEVGSFGSRFELVARDGQRIPCTTKLLGRHNIQNITGAAALAYRLGLSGEEIAAGIQKLESVEHRLQLIPGPVTVIDDAFNANPVGASEALEILKSFSGRRIIITPGIVELGLEQNDFNREFGRHMASCVDIAMLVGPNADFIKAGLQDEKFPESCIITVDTLAEATEKLPLYQEPGCTVLFENDLTDNYQ